jgi:hypothetical protein
MLGGEFGFLLIVAKVSQPWEIWWIIGGIGASSFKS